jgi:hypothetical protein
VTPNARDLLEPGSGTDPAEIERDWSDLLRFHARVLQARVASVNRVGEEAVLCSRARRAFSSTSGRGCAAAGASCPCSRSRARG